MPSAHRVPGVLEHGEEGVVCAGRNGAHASAVGVGDGFPDLGGGGEAGFAAGEGLAGGEGWVGQVGGVGGGEVGAARRGDGR